MASRVTSILEGGHQGVCIDIECHLSNGLPVIVIVGFASKAVDEAKERIRSAFTNSQLQLPRKRITLNLAPADIPKDGTSFDLAMATAVLQASSQTQSDLSSCAIIGELSLTGEVRPVRGIIGKILAGRKLGITTYYLPRANLEQARLIPGITIYSVTSLQQLYQHLTGVKLINPVQPLAHTQLPSFKRVPLRHDFRHVAGQARAKRALEIAAAGHHNILLNGPPGTGKSMLAKAVPGILPNLSREEILEITHLHSLSSRNYDELITHRPFRAPHHSASEIAIIGGGQNPRPGEISLSHRGVLFFDEMPEFSRSTIEALRQPLEDHVITVARAKDTVQFPAEFILVATSNPCPCGYYGSHKACTCLPQQIFKYQKKLSGPIMDRIDLFVEVDEIVHERLLADNHEEPSAAIQKRVEQARQRQRQRYQKASKHNGNLSNEDIKQRLKLSPEAQQLLNQAADKLQLSARSYIRIIRVSQTIADLGSADTITPAHIGEALQYRHQPITL